MVDEIVGRIWTTLRDKPYIAVGIAAVLVLVGLLVLFSIGGDGPGSADGGSTAAETVSSEPVVAAVDEILGGGTVDVEVTSTGPSREDRAFSAFFDWDTEAGIASGETDMGDVINDSGIFGEHDTVPTAFDGTHGYFEVVPGETPWLDVDLDSGSPKVGADIAALRDALLVNPVVLGGLLGDIPAEVEKVGDTYSFTMSLHGSIDDEVLSEAAGALRRDWAIDNVPVAVTLDDSGGLESVEVSYSYPVVPGAPDNVDVTITYGFAPAGDAPELPDDSDTVTYEELSS